MSTNYMLQNLKDASEKDAFIEAQNKTIIQLTKKIQKLEEERNHLKSLLEQSVPLVKTEESGIAHRLLTTDEETICATQLKILKDKSMLGELTLEESKKVELFSKILAANRNIPKIFETKSKQLKNEDLLALVEGNDSNRGR